MDRLKKLDSKQVRVFKTPGGVTGIVATCIPDAALAGLEQKLQAKIAAHENRQKRSQKGRVDLK